MVKNPAFPRVWSPLEIEMVLLAHYSSGGIEAEPTHDSPAHQAARARLVRDGLVERSVSKLYTTDLGEAFVDLICSTPIPVVRFIDPREEPPHA